MGRPNFKFVLAIVATAFLGAGFGALDAMATGMYDMRGFLSQGHPFDVTDRRNQAPAPVPVQSRPVAPQPVVTRQPVAHQPVVPATPAYRPVARQKAPEKTTDSIGIDRPSSTQMAARGSDKNNNRAPLLGFISEFRVGGLAHDQGPFSHNKEDGYDINAEILFASPAFMDIVWSPRPHIGATRNSIGRTSQVYLGITWDWDFWDGFFYEFAWGAAGHDGNKVQEDPDVKDLGCHLLFREAMDFGYRLGGHGISLHLAHISNAKLCDKNEGLETVGLRYGYSF